MTDLSRGTRARRAGRRPGWVLLTVLLVLAIGASSALVFTNQVELLKLAVILALWAAVVAAFVSVIYRRQSDIDQAKVRDLKFVYDLQLDREISARREYELTVETQLRRELTSEIRAQAADEVAGLRAELAALRANLEILFDADLSHRPAIETDRSRAYGDWPHGAGATGRVTASRIDTEDSEDFDAKTEESPIIDVPAEPHPPEPESESAQDYGGAHRRPSETAQESERHRAEEQPRAWPPPPPQPVTQPIYEPQTGWQPMQPERPPAPPPEPPPAPPPPPATHPEPEPVGQGPEWEPAPAEGQWIPAGAPGSNWLSSEAADESTIAPEPHPPEAEAQPPEPEAQPAVSEPEPVSEPAAAVSEPEPTMSEPEPAPEPQPTESDLSAQPTESDMSAQPTGENGAAEYVGRRRAAEPAMQTPSAEDRRGRHSAPADAVVPGRPHEEPEEPVEAASPPAGRRHRSAEDTGGQSVAELLARLQASPTGGGGRRRRDE